MRSIVSVLLASVIIACTFSVSRAQVLSTTARLPGAEVSVADRQIVLTVPVAGADSGGTYWLTSPMPFAFSLVKAFVKVQGNSQVDSSGEANGRIRFFATPNTDPTVADSLKFMTASGTVLDTGAVTDRAFLITGAPESVATRWSRFGVKYDLVETYGPDTTNDSPDTILVSAILQIR